MFEDVNRSNLKSSLALWTTRVDWEQ